MVKRKDTAIFGVLMVSTLLIALWNGFAAKSPNVRVSGGGPTLVPGGPISGNETWNCTGSPYIVVDNVFVTGSGNLTIEPGVIVKFASGKYLAISGILTARGNLTHAITFTSNSTTKDWNYLWFDGKVLVMDYVVIEYANFFGLHLVTTANISNTMISKCTVGADGELGYANNLNVTDNSGDGLRVSDSLVIKNSNVISNGGHGINMISGSALDMDNCIVCNNTGDGIVLAGGGYINNSGLIGNGGNGSSIFGPTTIENSQISNNSGDGIWTESSVSITECNVTGNKNGVRGGYSAGAIKIQNSTLSFNKLDGIYTNSSVEIRNCDVWNNTGNGVNAARDVSMNVFSSNILNNTLNGLSGCGYVYYSNVTGNTMAGILGNFKIDNYTSITLNNGGGFNGTGSVYSSSIFNNTPYDAVADIWPNNITATDNWWGTNDSNLIDEHIWDYNDTSGALGHVFALPWLQGPANVTDKEPPRIVDPIWNGIIDINNYTSLLYNGTSAIRKNEPVLVSVYVTDIGTPIPSGVDKVFLSCRVDGGEWWNTTMMYDEKSGNWTARIPGQPASSTVEFFIQAYDKVGNKDSTIDYHLPYRYVVIWLPTGDINGDGKVDMKDIVQVILNFGKTC